MVSVWSIEETRFGLLLSCSHFHSANNQVQHKMIGLRATIISCICIFISVATNEIGMSGDVCATFRDCVSCTNTATVASSSCRWCGKCVSKVSTDSLCKSGDNIIRYDDTCSVERAPLSPYLGSWMGSNLDAIGHLSLLDISLPGTHDTLTYDLSLITSDGGVDGSDTLAKILHDYESIVPDSIEDFLRQQAQTHQLDIIEQLNNGMRFLDLRIMYEYSDEVPDWYSLHFMQSNAPASAYLKSIRYWMDEHPQEIVVMWLSKHGSTGAVGKDQYPETPIEAKQKFWSEIESIFSGIIVDFAQTKINETSIDDMIARNQRAVFYVADYEEFTGFSRFALDSRLIDNQCGPSVDAEVNALAWERDLLANSEARISELKKSQSFFLMSMATGVPIASTVLEAAIRFLPNVTDLEVVKCAEAFNIPSMHWCPQTLLDIGQLENYYKQITLEEALMNPGWGFPNAIYINAVAWEGTIRTGTKTLWGAVRSEDMAHQDAAYAYADTMILHNVQKGCNALSTAAASQGGAGAVKAKAKAASCPQLIADVQERRAKFPQTFWTDAKFGRLENWP